MALVVLPVKTPAVLEGQDNGKLDADILRTTPGLSGGPTVRLVEPAMRCWQAMTAAASADGIILRTSSYADSYRTYQVQVSTFTARYQIEPTTNGYRLWDSDGNGVRERWYKKDGVATAAVPGTSNHGWAIAVDVANASGARLAWLERYAVTFGWSWELVPEEPWHLRNYSGDDIPAKVLAYEQEQQQMSEDNAYNGDAHGNGISGMQATYKVIPTPVSSRATAVMDNKLAAAVTSLQADVTALKVAVAQILGLLQDGIPVPGEVNLTEASVEAVADKVGEVISDTKVTVTLDAG